MIKFNYEDAIIVVASPKDAKSIYKSILRAGRLKSGLTPLYSDFPKFSENKEVYGVMIDNGYVTVVNDETLVSSLIPESLRQHFERRWL